MKTIAVLAILGLAAVAFLSMSSGPSSEVEEAFRDFLETNRVGYGSTEEYNYRLGVFQENLKTIERLNNENPEAFFAVNMFADQTPEEMKQRMGLISVDYDVNAVHKTSGKHPEVDWHQKWGKVKNQGACGSCWAFSATATFEGRYAISQKKGDFNTNFSEQQLVDCNKNGCYGCSGGWMHLSFDYLTKNGFCTEQQYPYSGRDGTCQYASKGCDKGPKCSSYKELPFGNEDALLEELQNGPVAVAVDATSWSYYSGGILSSCSKNINHGVTLVTSSPSGGFARIRNSWGPSWGEGGHIRIKLDQNTCNYAIKSSIPVF